MPGLLKKEEPAGAICCNVEENHATSENVPQPTQPNSLQGLLRFAMETNANQDGAAALFVGPGDDERKRFLEDALNFMTINVTELLLKQVKVFENVERVTLDDDISEYTQAFDTILDHVDNIDVANDFHKIGGFTIFNPSLRCVNPKIRAGACNILAELCQNNLYCQRVAVDNNFIPLLIKILDEDEEEVCVKALYALSCIVRQNPEGYRILLNNDGFDVILKTIKKKHDTLRTKSAFLLSALCQLHCDLKDVLINLGYLPTLITILSEEHVPICHKYVASLLKYLIEENATATNICRNPQYNLEQVLRHNLDVVKDKEESLEEYEYCRHLLDRLFPDWNN